MMEMKKQQRKLLLKDRSETRDGQNWKFNNLYNIGNCGNNWKLLYIEEIGNWKQFPVSFF